MSTARALREKWAKDRAAFGVWAALPGAFTAELVSVERVDYVCVDQQHGLIDYADVVAMLPAIESRGSVPLTRVPANQAWLIGKSLDAGAQGVIVPLVSNREGAESAAAACRYPPKGVRSYGPMRSPGATVASDAATPGQGVLCFVMVETREGLANIDEIASTPGVDGIYIGPADLALGLGLTPALEKEKEDQEHVAAVRRILQACQRRGIVAGIHCGSGRSARRYAEDGFRLITFGKDSTMLQAAVRRELGEALRAEIAETGGRDGLP